VLKGRLPKRALSLVRQWGKLHEAELVEAWHNAESRVPLRPIAPLD
jgi:hypothetical protein